MRLASRSELNPAAEEAALLGRVAAGELAAPMTALYGLYGGRLYGLGMRLLGDPGMAEDLVQETFVRLWRSAGRFDSNRGTVRTFLFTIARRAAVDLMRRSASRPLPTGSGGEESDERPTEDDYDGIVLGIDLRDALQALAPKHREVLELVLDQDLSQPEIAERLGIPLGTVKTRTYYGLRALKAELEERGIT